MEQKTMPVVLIPWQIKDLLSEHEVKSAVGFNSNWYSLAVVELEGGGQVVFKKEENRWYRKQALSK